MFVVIVCACAVHSKATSFVLCFDGKELFYRLITIYNARIALQYFIIVSLNISEFYSFGFMRFIFYEILFNNK